MFGSIKTTMMEFFDDCYATIAETAAAATSAAVAGAGVGTGRVFQYWDFDYMKPRLSMEFRTQSWP